MAAHPLTRDERLRHFDRLVKAYRVRAENGQWVVKKLGGKPRVFSAKNDALQVAKRKAASEHVGVLVFEDGHVSEVS
jgi:hypothetical protein